MTTIKKGFFLIPLLLLFSCNRIDKESSIGSDVIAKIDSSAVEFDGVFQTDSITPTSTSWSKSEDSLSGLHRYKEYLKKGSYGQRQSEYILGKIASEESFVYATFSYDTSAENFDTISIEDSSTGLTIGDSIILNDTIGSISYLINNYFKDGYSSVHTSLLFYSDSNKQVNDDYILELSSVPFVEDSMKIDTLSRQVIRNTFIEAGKSKYIVNLPYTYFLADTGDTIIKTENTVTHNTSSALEIHVSRYLVSSDSLALEGEKRANKSVFSISSDQYMVIDTIFSLDDTIISESSTFSTSEIIPFYALSNLDSTIVDSVISTGNGLEQYPYTTLFVDTVYDYFTNPYHIESTSTDTIVDTVFHSYLLSAVEDTAWDTLTFTETYRHRDSLKVPLNETIDTLVIYDTLFTTISKVYQEQISQSEIVNFSVRSAVEAKDSAIMATSALDTLQILMKNKSEDTVSLFPIKNISLKLVAYKDDAPKDSVYVLARRTNMTVFNTGNTVPNTYPRISGGLESFAQLTLDSDAFWKSVLDNQYLSIVQGVVTIPVDSFALPEYVDTVFSLRAILTQDSYFGKNGELLSDSTLLNSTYATCNLNDSTITVDIRDYLVDMRYEMLTEGRTTAPKTNLYLWMDGTQMGQVDINRNNPYTFTYIVQNKLN